MASNFFAPEDARHREPEIAGGIDRTLINRIILRKTNIFENYEDKLIFDSMIPETHIRSQLIRRIQRIPSSKLNELSELVTKLEHTSSYKDKNLSFAGAWSNIDSDTFDDLTENLVENRAHNHKFIG